MTPVREISILVLGFLLVLCSPVAYKKYKFDGLVCFFAFLGGICLVVYGHC